MSCGKSLRSPALKFLKGFKVAVWDNFVIYFLGMINFKGIFCFENNKYHKHE